MKFIESIKQYSIFRPNDIQLNCFSPPVMVATFIIEIILLIYTFYKFKKSSAFWVVSALLFFLALFQLSEYFVCGGFGIDAKIWSKIGYVSISTLPPLGLHILQIIRGRRFGALNIAAYASMAGFCALFLLQDLAFKGHVCTGNYVIFQIRDSLNLYYGAYYYGWMIITIYIALMAAKTADKKRAKAMVGLVIGYLVFLVPTSITIIIHPPALDGIPSVMCGFAIMFALMLPTVILPAYYKSLKTPKKPTRKPKKN